MTTERKTISQVLDDLQYTSYATQRDRFPEVSFLAWVKVYGEAALRMENRYMAEKLAVAL